MEGNHKISRKITKLSIFGATGNRIDHVLGNIALLGIGIEHDVEIELFDEKLGILLTELRDDDLLILTADHGNDPTYTGTDHTREYVPFIAYSPSMEQKGKMEGRDTFAVIGATIADNFGVEMPDGTIGESVLSELL